MKEELLSFIRKYDLSPFSPTKTSVKPNGSIYKTKDAKLIHNKVLQKISSNFIFSDTSNLFHVFGFTNDLGLINKRQSFFRQIQSFGKKENIFLKDLNIPRAWWKPKYDVMVVTESTEMFSELKLRGCPVQLLISENDVAGLSNYDVVQVLDCPDYRLVLETLPQSVFLNSIDEAYVERYLEVLSGWVHNLEVLKKNELSVSLNELLAKINPLMNLVEEKDVKILSRDFVEDKVEEINNKINERIREMTISGDSIVALLSKGAMPEQLREVVNTSVTESCLPSRVLNLEIPVSIDEENLEKVIAQQSASEFSSISEDVKSHADSLRKIPYKLQELCDLLLFFDFVTGVSQFIESEMKFPILSEELRIVNSKNIFLDKSQPISFYLNSEEKCSILTGANSGGKTTLIEHVIQLISLGNLGMPVFGNVSLPKFTDVYYFAKNKGSMSKGAFETLLTQMSEIQTGAQTLILADEIEAVTEPGVAGNIIAATADFYIKQNCFMIVATHLGHEIVKMLPEKTRVDGIEAKGLDENFELIVDHNPVLGRLAHSTPELIVEKMARNSDKDYFEFLNNWLKK